ncbi:dihydrofolate reductase family protein [Gordonia sp. VNK21]|uniref:dihydrofolate reductase family protein n=1 Tax=Gordonia sp. VNK21 TaxID=3382483 RepID=UPI0038D3E5FB
MSRIVYDTATTLNGWIADEQDSLDWLFAVPGGDEPPEGTYPESATVLVMGSHTYEWVLRHEDLLTRPERWQEWYAGKHTFVFSSRALPIPDGADITLVSGPVADALPRLRAAAGGADIWVMGGGDLAGQFLDAGALDRIAVSVAPAALPGGAPLLPRRVGPDRLRLVSAEAVGPFARLVYEVGPAAE